jgi:hypothetical protein
VVEGQRLTQAASDIFLGWDSLTGLDGQQRDYYVRQLWDWKLSVDLPLRPEALTVYGQMCAWALARGHARSGDRLALGAYLGKGEEFERAISDFAEAYADQNERDHADLLAAVKAGRVHAVQGV